MADNKRGRGDRDENQENSNECKSVKAIKLLREVTSLLREGDSEPDQPAAEQIRQARSGWSKWHSAKFPQNVCPLQCS